MVVPAVQVAQFPATVVPAAWAATVL